MEDPATWKTDAKVWRGWWDLLGWFWLIRDFGFRGAIAHVRWAAHMHRLSRESGAQDSATGTAPPAAGTE